MPEAEPAVKVNPVKVTLEAQSILSIRDTVNLEEMEQIHATLYGELGAFMGKNGIEQSAMPIAITHKWDPPKFIDMECGIPIGAMDIATEGRVKLNTTHVGDAMKVEHWGDYHELEGTYNAFFDWLEKEGIEPAGAPWEVYITDPGTEPDVAKWLTEIYVPL